MSGSAFFHSVKQIVVDASRLGGVARERERSRQLQPRQRVYGIDEHDASMVDNPLKLGGGLYRLLRRQIRQAANVDRIELAEVPIEADAARGEVEAGGRLQRLNRRCRITCVQCEQSPQRR